jgi:hypothetical protein
VGIELGNAYKVVISMKSQSVEEYLAQLSSKDDEERLAALQAMLKLTEQKVDWFPRYKDGFLQRLTDENSYQRSIGMMLLCNLAKSETPKEEYKKILPEVMRFIDDEKFITQRQYLQNVWKIAIEKKAYKKAIVEQLANEFVACVSKKHFNLLRQDIIASLIQIKHTGQDAALMGTILELIEKEDDGKNRKKLMALAK